MKSGIEQARFTVRADVEVTGTHMLTFRCELCGNEGAVVCNGLTVALYCTACFDGANVKPRLRLIPVRVEVKRG